MGIGTTVVRVASKAKVGLIKNAPQIAVVAGVGMLIGAAVCAGKESIAAKEVIDDAKELMAKCEESFVEDKVFLDKNDDETKPYSYDVYQHDMRTIFLQTVAKLIKIYGPAILLASGGSALIFWAFNTINKALIGANLALQALNTKYDRLYKFAVDEFGEAKIQDIVDGVTIARTEKVKNPETGKMETKNIYEVPDNIPSNWIIWGPEDSSWDKEESYRDAYLRKIQSIMTDALTARDLIWLSEVVEMFGKHDYEDQEEEFRVTGWIGPNNKHFDPDVMDGYIKINKRVLDDGRWLLTFNTDGMLLPYLPQRKKRLDWGLGKYIPASEEA
jgi:hypothetical protein